MGGGLMLFLAFGWDFFFWQIGLPQVQEMSGS